MKKTTFAAALFMGVVTSPAALRLARRDRHPASVMGGRHRPYDDRVTASGIKVPVRRG